ncbi:MAG: NAD(+) synthase [Candidatus Melainabacteria bacterium]
MPLTAPQSILLAQLNPTPGDLAGNAQLILEALRHGEEHGVGLVVSPELALTGYPILDALMRFPDLGEQNLLWLDALARRTGETHLLVGFVEPRRVQAGDQRIGNPFFNSVAWLGEGKLLGIIRKSLLPCYEELNDPRIFEASPAIGVHPPDTLANSRWGFQQPTGSPGVAVIHGVRYGVVICEDSWNDDTFMENTRYTHDPNTETAALKPDVIMNLSASPSRMRKEQLRHHMLAHIARRHRLPLVYVNQVGANDEIIFDGASRAYDADGALTHRARVFATDRLIVTPALPGRVEPLPEGQDETLSDPRQYLPGDPHDLGRTYAALTLGIRDYFAKTGFRRAVLGLSGGLDSTVTAVLLADALGPENVLGVSMPSTLTPAENRDDARQLAENLGILFEEIPIADAVAALQTAGQSISGALSTHWGGMNPQSAALENAQAITRATVLRGIGNDYDALPIATSDKSELMMGYATVNGDMSGAIAPLADVVKTKVFALARWLNGHRERRNVIPQRIIDRKPGADLRRNAETGELVHAEEDLMPYLFLDEIIWREENIRQTMSDMLTERFAYEDTHPLPSEEKQAWLERYYFRRDRLGVFKWKVAPPALITDAHGINTATYAQSIVTRIHHPGHTRAEIEQILNSTGALNASRPLHTGEYAGG